jgi:hypothetical protein
MYVSVPFTTTTSDYLQARGRLGILEDTWMGARLRRFWLTVLGLVAKTRTQLNRRLPDAAKLPWPPFGKAWYAGCTTLIIGNSLKAGIRRSPAHKLLVKERRRQEHRIRGFRSVQGITTRFQWEYIGPENSDCWVWSWCHRVSAGCYSV